MRLKALILISLLSGVMAAQSSAGENYTHPHQYIESLFESWKQPHDGSMAFDDFTGKLVALKNALPDNEVALRSKIDDGIAALNKMRDHLDDSDISKLSSMAADLSRYYRSTKEGLIADRQGALSLAFFALDEGEPPRFFEQRLLGPIFSSYLSHYPQKRFNTPIPVHIHNAMVDGLDWVTPRNDGEQSGLNTPLVYTLGAISKSAVSRLDKLDPKQRELVLDELEIALETEPDCYGAAIEAEARATLKAVRVLYPKNR